MKAAFIGALTAPVAFLVASVIGLPFAAAVVFAFVAACAAAWVLA
jgi:hypothetical protein